MAVRPVRERRLLTLPSSKNKGTFSMDREAPWQYDKSVIMMWCVSVSVVVQEKYGSHILFYNEIMFLISDTASVPTLLS